MPAGELEVFRVATNAGCGRIAALGRSAQIVADIGKGHPIKGVVITKHYAYANDKIEALPPFEVSGAVSDVRLRGGQAASVLVAAAVYASTRVIRLSRLGKL